jgi:hypothetical protein
MVHVGAVTGIKPLAVGKQMNHEQNNNEKRPDS